MRTNCPQCKTRFRVTEEQLQAAEGYVRCSICREVFNVYNVADETSGEQSDPLSRPDISSADQYTADTTRAHTPAGSPELTMVDEFQKDSFDFFDKESNEMMEHVVPDEFRQSPASGPHSAASSLLWGFGFLLLSLALVIEYTWFNRDQLIQISSIRSEIETLCQSIDCKFLSIRDPSKIELVTRNIYSHPNEEGVLLVNLTMKNNAGFSQPYPVMNINFSDVRGTTVASRHFFPNEYLPSEYRQLDNGPSKILPADSTSITLEIQDPGKQAITYEFDFL